MVYTISLDNGFSGEHMGLVFANGEAHTDDAFLASRLRSKGYSVTSKAVADDETVSDRGEAAEELPDLDKMNLAQLKEFAESRHIDISGAKTKFEVVAAISEAVYESE